MIATSAAQSMGKAIPALILSISRQGILYIPLLLISNATLGFNGFIYAQPITDATMRILSSIYITIILNKEQLPKYINTYTPQVNIEKSKKPGEE